MQRKELKADIEKLIALGKKKGFLTYDEVNETLSEKIDSSEEIDHFNYCRIDTDLRHRNIIQPQ